MNPDPKRVESLFAEALTKAIAAERHALLDEQCGDDIVLRQRVEVLLKAHDDAGGFLEASAEVLGSAETSTIGFDNGTGWNSGSTVRYFGDYELIDEIARGGMGVVYRARQVSLNRIVAIKMILAGQFASSEARQRFQAEANTAANLDHPHIVPIYEIGEHEGNHYFSMKLIEGGSLASYRRQLTMSGDDQRTTARLLATIARAVHHAHQRGVLHRDLKPGNVLIDAQGQPHITDFGLAKHDERDCSITRSGAIVGTPSYMAPEQARAEKRLTTAVDVYSLGAILYELLTGKPPFQGATVLDTLMQVQQVEPRSPRSIERRIPRDLETICLKCLRKQPEKRYESAAAVAEELDRWLKCEPILASSVGNTERLIKWVRRRPAISALLATVVLLSVVGFSLVTWKWRESLHNERRAMHQLERAETALYVNRVARAHSLWKDDDVQRARALLDECREPLRGWEWHYVNGLCNNCLLSLKAARDLSISQLQVAFSPDGNLLASASQSPIYVGVKGNALGEVHIWDLRTGQEHIALQEHIGTISCGVAFSPDGKFLASGGWEQGPNGLTVQRARVWEVATGTEMYRISGGQDNVQGCTETLAFSPDGRYLAAGSRDCVVIVEAVTGKRICKLDGPGGSLSFKPDSRFLASAGRGANGGWSSVMIWDTQNWKQASFVPPNVNARSLATQDDISGLTYSPDGNRLATWGKHVRIWDATTGAELMTMSGFGPVAWNPDGRRMAVGGRVLDAESGAKMFAMRGTGGVRGVAFSPDGSLLATGSAAGRTVRVWDATRAPEVQVLNEGNFRTGSHRIDGLALSANDDRIAFAFSDGVLGKRTLAARVCTVESGRELLSLTNLGAEVEYPHSAKLAFSRDNRRFAIATGTEGTRQTTVRVFDVASGGASRTLELTNQIDHIIFSPDGNLLSIRTATELSLYDLSDGRKTMLSEGPFISTGEFCSPLVFSPDGSLAAVVGPSPKNELRLVKIPGGNVVRTLEEKSGQPIAVGDNCSIAIGADGRQMILFDVHDRGRILVWDIESGQLLHSHAGNIGLAVERLSGGAIAIPHILAAISPDGTRLAVAPRTGTLEVSVWDTITGQEVLTLRRASQLPDTELLGLCWSADSSTLALADELGDVQLWDASMTRKRERIGDQSGWHSRAGRDAERKGQWFEAAFHLQQLLNAKPSDTEDLKERLRICEMNLRKSRR